MSTYPNLRLFVYPGMLAPHFNLHLCLVPQKAEESQSSSYVFSKTPRLSTSPAFCLLSRISIFLSPFQDALQNLLLLDRKNNTQKKPLDSFSLPDMKKEYICHEGIASPKIAKTSLKFLHRRSQNSDPLTLIISIPLVEQSFSLHPSGRTLSVQSDVSHYIQVPQSLELFLQKVLP